MERETIHTKHHRQAILTPTLPPPPPDQTEQSDPLLNLSKSAGWLFQLSATQVGLLSTIFVSPLSALFSDASRVPLSLGAAIRRVALGLLYVACICFTLLAALVISILIGVALVRFWVEEPVSLQSKMHFDYTHPQPFAAVPVGDGFKGRGIPAGHVATVWLELVMPESDYNRRVGVFQVTAEAVSSNGNIVATSSQPCMLKFRSLPIQLSRTLLMGIPLLMGILDESHKLVLEILRYKESIHETEVIMVRLKPRTGTSDLPHIYQAHTIIKTQLPRTKELVYRWKWTFESIHETEVIMVRLKIRAGTSDLPQIYQAHTIITTQLPQTKELVYRWKWTFYIWISLYVYAFLLISLCYCSNPLGFSRGRSNGTEQQSDEVMNGWRYYFDRSGGEFSDALSRWRERRSKVKVVFPDADQPELKEGSASSPAGGETIPDVHQPELKEGSASSPAGGETNGSGGETSEVMEDFGDFVGSESSVCVGG